MGNYFSIDNLSNSDYREKGSKFLAFAYPLTDEEAVNAIINELWQAHPKASHVCYAYRIGLKGEKSRMNDNGEPANTAGAPIMNHLKGKELTFTGVFVVRYFGGSKLGKGGLINAYGTATKQALDKARVVLKTFTIPLTVKLPYTEVNDFMQLVKKHNIEMGEQVFDNTCEFTIYVPVNETEAWKNRLSQIKEIFIQP